MAASAIDEFIELAAPHCGVALESVVHVAQEEYVATSDPISQPLTLGHEPGPDPGARALFTSEVQVNLTGAGERQEASPGGSSFAT